MVSGRQKYERELTKEELRELTFKTAEEASR